MSSRRTFVAALLALFTLEARVEAQFAKIRRSLTKQHTLAPLRLFFTTEGIHAVESNDSDQDKRRFRRVISRLS
ncbi:MAG: hypothetical protein ACJASX_002157 [Limisphaerales bacterium]|jgi:hypothetical protein